MRYLCYSERNVQRKGFELERREKEYCKGQGIVGRKNVWSFVKVDNKKVLSICSDIYEDFINQVFLVFSYRKFNLIGLKEKREIYWFI